MISGLRIDQELDKRVIPNKPGLYLLYFQDLTKIGSSRRLRARVETIAKILPGQSFLLAYSPIALAKGLGLVERIQEAFSDQLLKDDWFRLGSHDVEKILQSPVEWMTFSDVEVPISNYPQLPSNSSQDGNNPMETFFSQSRPAVLKTISDQSIETGILLGMSPAGVLFQPQGFAKALFIPHARIESVEFLS